MSVSETLAERGKRYGDFSDHAEIAQRIKIAMIAGKAKWASLPDTHKQALEVIADKIARILSGDPNYADNWHDIQGYAKLVEDRLPAVMTDDFGQQNQLDTGAMRFETVRDWVKWAWNGSFVPDNPREEAISAVKRSNGKMIICELGFQAGPFKDGGFTGKGCLNASPVGGPMLRCHDCIAEHCACIAS